jgi:hypothetical protein
MERLAFQPSDLDALWESMNAFWADLRGNDWRRRHGRDWTFADPIYHLTAFNHGVVGAIQRASDAPLPSLINTLADMDRWNARQFGERPAYISPEQLQHDFKASQIELREASDHLDQAVYLPFLRVGGWRTLHFALEYTFYHTWLHFSELHLRRQGWLPGLPDRMMHIGLDFLMEMRAGAVHLERARRMPLHWTLHLTDRAGGTWTFEIAGNGCTVYDTQHGKPDILTTMSIETFLKTFIFGIGSPTRAMLAGRMRVHGARRMGRLRRLFDTPPEMVWPVMERDSAPRPVG